MRQHKQHLHDGLAHAKLELAIEIQFVAVQDLKEHNVLHSEQFVLLRFCADLSNAQIHSIKLQLSPISADFSPYPNLLLRAASQIRTQIIPCPD